MNVTPHVAPVAVAEEIPDFEPATANVVTEDTFPMDDEDEFENF